MINSQLDLSNVFTELNKLYEVSTISNQSIATALKEVDDNNIIEYDSIDDMFNSVGW